MLRTAFFFKSMQMDRARMISDAAFEGGSSRRNYAWAEKRLDPGACDRSVKMIADHEL